MIETGSILKQAADTQAPQRLEAPAAIFNCPECSHWLAPGTLACPDCHTLVYAGHMKRVATAALAEEGAEHLPQARAIWQEGLAWLPAGTKQYEAVAERIALLDQRVRGIDDWRAKWTRRLGPFAPVLFFLSKLKGLLFLLKLKFLLTFLGSFGFYWAIFGWKFGLGFVLSILVHEMGHYVAARRRGLRVDLPVFLPGLGAYVRWYAEGVSLATLSAIALAGPTAGLGVALVCGLVAKTTAGHTSELFSALAHVAAWLNLLNLTPIFGLDGAQATYALDRTQRLLVMATALIFFGVTHQWIMLPVAIGMLWRVVKNDVPDRPGTPALMRYVMLIFLLGVVAYVFPDSLRRF